MSPPKGAEGGGGFPWPMILMMLVVLYFFMILPQTRRNKKMKAFKEEVTKGTKIITTGGIHGKIVAINDDTYTIETEGHSKLKIQKSAVSLELTQAMNKAEGTKDVEDKA